MADLAQEDFGSKHCRAHNTNQAFPSPQGGIPEEVQVQGTVPGCMLAILGVELGCTG